MWYNKGMKAVIQRVKRAKLSVAGQVVSEIEQGLCVYFGVEQQDTPDEVVCLCNKLVNLRVFSDSDGKMNLSVKDVNGEILLISQFTLSAACAKGNRPSFSAAAPPDIANNLYVYAQEYLRGLAVPIKTGIFGADMTIDQQNDGPVTIILTAADGKII